MSRTENFYADFSKIRYNLERNHIPEKKLHDEMLAFLIGNETAGKQKTHTYENWKRR